MEIEIELNGVVSNIERKFESPHHFTSSSHSSKSWFFVKNSKEFKCTFEMFIKNWIILKLLKV